MSFKNLFYSAPLYVLLSIVGQFSLAADYDSLRTERKNGRLLVIHKVEQGETLYSLSRRYGSATNEVINQNNIQNNEISIGQLLEIPIEDEKSKAIDISDAEKSNKSTSKVQAKSHTVAQGETLFSISRSYGVSVVDLKKWNDLTSNEISIGQELIVSKGQHSVKNTLVKQTQPPIDREQDILQKSGYRYHVRSGDNMESIARKFNVEIDSIKKWNGMLSSSVFLGQELFFPFEIGRQKEIEVTTGDKYNKTAYGSKINSFEDGGVVKIREEGVAMKIDTDLNTTNYLAMHRTLSTGTVLQVKNLMNNKRIYVRVVGQLPDTGNNQNIMIRLTPISFEKLGILDEKSMVEITYFKQ